MKDASFEGFGVDDDGTPVMAFDVEMRSGQDFDGKLRYQIAAIRGDDEDVVALVQPSGDVLATLSWSDDLDRWLEETIDEGGYRSIMTYENLSWDDVGGGQALPILGLPDGKTHTEFVSLDDRSIDALEQIRDHFQGAKA